MYVELLGWAAAGFTLLTFSMRTMLPLRVSAIVSNVFFISYAGFGGLYPVLVLHLLLLPFNVLRLAELLRTRRSIARARQGALDPKVLRGMTTARKTFAQDDMVFRKGDPPDFIYDILSGRVGLEGVDVELGPGEVFGEMPFSPTPAPGRSRRAASSPARSSRSTRRRSRGSTTRTRPSGSTSCGSSPSG